MKRCLAITILALLMVSALASSAVAKGISFAHFSGPGLPSRGVTMRGDSEGLFQTGLLEPKMRSVHLSVSELGASYRASYRVDYAPHVLLHQVLYPYAKGGPVTFTPYGQHIGQDHSSFPGGWYYALSDLRTFLTAHGFPRRDPTAPAGRVVAEPAVADAPVSSVPWPWFGLGGAILLAAGTTILARRRLRS
jgi:hypothetical protein